MRVPDGEQSDQEWLKGSAATAPQLGVPGPSEARPAPQSQAPAPAAAPAAPAAEEPDAEWLSRSVRQRSSALGAAVEQGAQLQPDRAARVVRMGFKTGYAQDFVDQHLEELETEASRKDVDWGAFARRSPSVADYITTNPHFAGVAPQEIQKLGDLEAMLRKPKALWRTPQAKIEERAAREAKERAAVEWPENQESRRAEEEAGLPPSTTFYASQADMEEKIRQDLLAGRTALEDYVSSDNPVGLVEAMKKRANENPAFALPFVSKVIDAGEAARLYLAIKANEAGKANEEQKQYLQDVARLEAAATRRGTSILGGAGAMLMDQPAFWGEFAMTAGIFTGTKKAVEVGAEKLVQSYLSEGLKKVLLSSSGRVLGRFGAGAVAAVPQSLVAGGVTTVGQLFERMGKGEDITSALPKALVDTYAEIASEHTGGAFEWLDKPLGKKLFGWFSKKVPGATAEAFQEFTKKAGIHGILGEMGEEEVGKLIKAAGGLEPYKLPSPQELATEALSFAAPGVTHAVLSHVGGASPAKEPAPPANSEFFKALGEVLGNLETTGKKTPEAIEKLVAEATKGRDNEFVYAPIESWNSYWQEQGLNPRDQAVEILGSPEAAAEWQVSKDTGRDLKIPLSRYAVTIATSEHNKFFEKELRQHPLETNEREEKELYQAEEERLKKEQAAPEVSAAKQRDEASRRVGESIETRLRELGRGATEARAAGKLWERVFRSLGIGAGMDPGQLYEKFAPLIERRQTPAADPGKVLNQADEVHSEGKYSVEETTQEGGDEQWTVYSKDGREFGTYNDLDDAHRQAKSLSVEDGDSATVHSLEITPALRTAALKEGFSLFQGDDDKAPPRGGYIPAGLAGNRAIINLYRSANESTFLHESGHLFLDVLSWASRLEGADPHFGKDFQTLLEWFGVKDAAAWDALSFEERRPFHEKFARGFETYLKKGEAPSSALRTAFAKFKLWITAIYRKLGALNVPLTPEVRGVMDRLVASEDEIRAAQAELGRRPLFAADEVLEEADRDAQEQLAKLAMDRVERERGDAWKEERDRIREGIEAEVNERPEYKALANLQRGRLPDGKPLPAGVQALKLSRAAIASDFGAEVLRSLPGGITSEEAGVHPDLAAGVFGFASGSELLRALAGTQIGPGGTRIATREAEARRRLGELEEEKKALDIARTPLEQEGKHYTKEVMEGREAIARKIERLRRQEERGKVADLVQVLREIKGRGGIRPSNKTELLPKDMRAKPGEGHGSDEIAQELADRGIIKDAYSDTLYDWINSAKEAIASSKSSLADITKESKALAREKVGEALEALEENAVQRAELRRLLQENRAEMRKVEKDQRELLIDLLADQRMEELHPDKMADQATLREEALRAVHNDKTEGMIRSDMQRLLSPEFARENDIKEPIRGKVLRPAALKAFAEHVVSLQKIKDFDPAMFLRSEMLSAEAAGRHFERREFALAFAAKQRELLNHALYRASTAAKERVEKSVEKFGKMFRPDKQQAELRDLAYVSAARAVLAEYGLGGTPGQDRATEYLRQVQEYDPEQYQNVMELTTSAIAGAVPYQEATMGKFLEMEEAVDALWELSRRTKQMLIDGKLIDREEATGELGARLMELGQPHAREGYDKAVSKWQKARMGLLGIRAALRRVESWVDQMDAGDPAGAYRKYIWTPISEATSVYREAKREVLQKYLEISKGVEKSLTRKPIAAPEIGYEFKDKAELLHALLHAGNDSNLQKLLRGRGWGEFDRDGVLDTSRWDAFIQRMWKEGILTKVDYEYAQAVWDLLESTKPAAQKAHKDMYGYYFGEVSARELDTPFGTYRGGYVPALVDQDIVRKQATREEKELVEKNDNSFMFPTTGRGFTKGRVEGYAKPLKLDLALLPAHLDKVLRFTHIEPRVKDVGRLVIDQSFRKLLDNFDKAVGDDMLTPWLQRAAQQKVEFASKGLGGRVFDNFARTLRKRTGQQIMVANVANTLQQLTGLSISAVKVKTRFLRNGLWAYMKGPGDLARDISERSLFMKNRVTGAMSELMSTIDELMLNPNLYEKARALADKHGYFMQHGTQNVVDLVTWAGAYEQAVEEGHDEPEAVRIADSVVRQTQGSGAPEDVSRAETGTPFVRLFNMFMGYFNMQANLLGTEYSKAMSELGLVKGLGRMAVVTALGFSIPAVLSHAITVLAQGGLDDEDDDGYLDDVLAAFFGSQFRAAVAMVPGGSVATALVGRFNNKPYDDHMSASPAFQAIDSAVGAPASVYNAFLKEDAAASKRKAVRDVLTLLGLATGLPFAPIGRPLGYMLDVDEGKANPTGPVDYTRGLITGSRGPR